MRVVTGSSDSVITVYIFLLNTVSVMEKRRQNNLLLKHKLDSRFNYFLEDLVIYLCKRFCINILLFFKKIVFNSI